MENNIFNKLYAEIGNIYGVCGLMGNIQAESALKSNNVQDSGNRRLNITDEQYTVLVDNGTYKNFVSDSIGYGLCQWTSPGRKQNLLNYAKSVNKSIGNEDMQLEFMINELKTSYKNVWSVLINATSVKEASDCVVTKFERPKDQSTSALLYRQRKSETFFEKYKGEINMTVVNVYSKAKDGNTNVSTNFKVKEFACADGSDPILISLKLVQVLQQIRTHFGKAVTINSAYRTPAYNKKVGGAEYSQHQYGTAADIKISGVSPKTVAAYAETLLGNKGGIGIYPTFTHIDVREVKSRWNNM